MLYHYPLIGMNSVGTLFLLGIDIGFFSFCMIRQIVVLDNPFLHQDTLGQAHINNLLRDHRMVIPINIVIMSSSFLMSGFMEDITIFVYCKLIFDSMSFLFARIVHISFILIDSRSWNRLLFCTIYESQKAWKILFNFLFWRFQPFCYVVYLLWDRYTLSN